MVDFLGSVEADSISAAEARAAKLFDVRKGERLMVEVDDDHAPLTPPPHSPPPGL